MSDEPDMSLFCHCHAMMTAVTISVDLETGKKEVIRCCKKCHPKAADMIQWVNDYFAGRRGAPDFTPDQVIDMALKEDETVWVFSQTRDKLMMERQEAAQREMIKQSTRLKHSDNVKWITAVPS